MANIVFNIAKGKVAEYYDRIKGNDRAWDGIRYGLDGYIQRSGALGQWERLGRQAAGG
mgnify:CR=1 FL=1